MSLYLKPIGCGERGACNSCAPVSGCVGSMSPLGGDVSDGLSLAAELARAAEGQRAQTSRWGQWWADNWIPATVALGAVILKGPDWVRLLRGR